METILLGCVSDCSNITSCVYKFTVFQFQLHLIYIALAPRTLSACQFSSYHEGLIFYNHAHVAISPSGYIRLVSPSLALSDSPIHRQITVTKDPSEVTMSIDLLFDDCLVTVVMKSDQTLHMPSPKAHSDSSSTLFVRHGNAPDKLR
jgi:hypothetical protein